MDGLAAKMKVLMGWDSPNRRDRMTLRTVAEGTGLSATYLWMLLSGTRSNPSAQTLERLAAYFGVDITYFHDQKEAPANPVNLRGRVAEIQALVEKAEAEGPSRVGTKLLEAWEFVRDSGPAALAARTALACTTYLRSRREYSRAEEVLRAVSRRWLARLPLDTEIEIQMAFARLAYEQARYFEAVERMETCLSLIQASGEDTPLAKDVWYNLGIFYRETGRSEDSVAAYSKALALYAPDERQDVAFIHMGLGRAYHDARQLDKALEHSSEALDILTALGDARWAGSVANNMGDILCDLERWHEARARYEAGMLAHRMVGYERGMALNLSGIARCQLELGDPKKALSTINQAIEELERLNEEAFRADTLLVRARVHLALSNWKKARADVEEAKTFFYERRMVAHLMRAVAVQAELDARMGALEQGAQNLRESAEVFRVLANHIRTVERAP